MGNKKLNVYMLITKTPLPTNAVCVIVPAFNEAKNIQATLVSLKAALPDAFILVVDNASTDDTSQISLAMGVTVIQELRKGKGFAISTGVAWALKEKADWIAFHDADNEYCAQGLAELLQACKRNTVPGPSMGVGLRQVTLATVHWRSLVANLMARFALKLSIGRQAPLDILTGTRVFNQQCAEMLLTSCGQKKELKGFELETALTRRAMQGGVCFIYAPVIYTPRALIEKKIRAWDMVHILKAAWTA